MCYGKNATDAKRMYVIEKSKSTDEENLVYHLCFVGILVYNLCFACDLDKNALIMLHKYCVTLKNAYNIVSFAVLTQGEICIYMSYTGDQVCPWKFKRGICP